MGRKADGCVRSRHLRSGRRAGRQRADRLPGHRSGVEGGRDRDLRGGRSATVFSASARRRCSARSRPSTAAACRIPSRRTCGRRILNGFRARARAGSWRLGTARCAGREPLRRLQQSPRADPALARDRGPARALRAPPVQRDHGQRGQAGAGSVSAGGGEDGGRADRAVSWSRTARSGSVRPRPRA